MAAVVRSADQIHNGNGQGEVAELQIPDDANAQYRSLGNDYEEIQEQEGDQRPEEDGEGDDSSLYEVPVPAEPKREANSVDTSKLLEDANPYLQRMLETQAELTEVKDRNYELENSIRVYKEMLYERDVKIKALQDQLLEFTGGANSENNTFQGIMMTLNQNAQLIKTLATSKNTKTQAEAPKPAAAETAMNEKYK